MDEELFEVDEYNERLVERQSKRDPNVYYNEDGTPKMFGFVPWTKGIESGHRFLAIVAVLFVLMFVALNCCR